MCEQSPASSADLKAGSPRQLPAGIKHLRPVYAMGRQNKSSNQCKTAVKRGKPIFSIMLCGEVNSGENQAALNPVRSGAETPHAAQGLSLSPVSTGILLPHSGTCHPTEFLRDAPFSPMHLIVLGILVLGAASQAPAPLVSGHSTDQGAWTFPLSLA